MIDLIFNNKPFGLRYDATNQTWQIIFETNLNQTDLFNLAKQGDTTNKFQDSSWVLMFTTDNEFYTITTRLMRYVFESDTELRFYFDENNRLQPLNGPLGPSDSDYVWTSVLNVVGDGYNNGEGNLNNGKGPITLTNSIPTGSILSVILPRL